MKTVFVLHHLHVLPTGEEDTKLIGTYSSNETARAAVERLKVQPGFCDYPRLIDPLTDDEDSGFYLDEYEYELDKDHWREEFVTEYRSQ
jgi:hypothetical protein